MGRRELAWVGALVLLALASVGVWTGVTHAAGHDLQVTFGTQGLEKVVYRGQVLADVRFGGDEQFRIWHMEATDLHGQKMTAGEFGWGENNSGKSWDLATKTWTYRYSWGRIKVQYVQDGDRLDLNVTEENRAGSGFVFQGATIYPVVLHVPETPAGYEGGVPPLTDNEQEPGVTTAEFGTGTIAVVVPRDGNTLYSGFEVQRQEKGGAEKNALAVTVSTVIPDSMKQSQGRRPGVQPGGSDSFTVSVRFGEAGVDAAQIAPDAYRAFAEHWPMTLNWPDRRPIGTVYLASSPNASAGDLYGDPRNPRRYFFGQNGERFDVRNADGLAKFQKRVLAQAKAVTENLRRMNAQAAITWDIEGEEYPQSTSYVCAPDQIGEVAPEMESQIAGGDMPYAGMKLDDAYFKVIRDAGFRVGVCVRPQHFEREASGKARQSDLRREDVARELIRKMRYAHDRWGATVFYLDSTVSADGRPLDAQVLEEAAAAVPDSLVIPEESTMRAYRATAPFLTFLFHGDIATPARVRAFYPKAFSANLVNDVSPAKLNAERSRLTDAVRQGDVLMLHAAYWQANNSAVVQMYRDAKSPSAKQ